MLRTSEFILNFVLNSFWQSAVIFAIAAIGSWLLRNAPARYRHTLWVAALSVSLIAPLCPANRWISNFQVVTHQTRPPLITELKNVAPVVSHSDKEEATVARVGRPRSQPVSTSTRTALFLALAYALFILWRAIRLARFWTRKERLRRSASDGGLSQQVEAAAQRCRSLLNVGDVRVSTSSEARVPYTLGWRRPMIVLPEAFFREADEARLLAVIGHEMAHVARRDFLVNLVCELVALPISFHPLIFLIKKQIDRARELACDELVTKRVLAPRVYASSLLWAADITRQHSSQAFMLSIFDAQILEERIMRLTRNKNTVAPGIARVIMFAALSILFVSAMSLSMFSLELQTQARGFEAIQLLDIPAMQHPVAPNVATSQSPRETQANGQAAENRAMTACEAGRRGDVQAIPVLIAQLADDSKTEFVKCWATGRWSPALESFKHPSPGEQAAIALASFGRLAFGPLSNQLDNPNATVRRNAAWAIGELTNMLPGERAGAVPQLISLLGDSDDWVRMASARALGELRDERALPRLIATLADDNWRVRQLVAWALSEMKDDRAVTALANVLLADKRVEVRRGAAEALGEIRSAEALPYLKQALNDSEVSAKAAWAIEEIEG